MSLLSHSHRLHEAEDTIILVFRGSVEEFRFQHTVLKQVRAFTSYAAASYVRVVEEVRVRRPTH